jgi:alanine dehydrogenase
MTPDGARQLVADGHEVLIEKGAGVGSGFVDAAYAQAGARLVDVEEVFRAPDLIAKVKEPNEREVARLRSGQTLFTYLHLAPNRALTESLLAADVIGLAYETIQSPDGSFPVLAPMSEVAGRLAVQIGVTLLQKDRGGKGLLVGGARRPRGRVTVVGAGIVDQCGSRRPRARRRSHRAGHRSQTSHLSLRPLPWRDRHALLESRQPRALGRAERPAGGRRLPARSARSAARQRSDGAQHGAGLGDRRRRRRPGRLQEIRHHTLEFDLPA